MNENCISAGRQCLGSSRLAWFGGWRQVSVFERAQNAYFNTLVMVDADGSIMGIYRKSHIPESPGYHEKFYFSPGTEFPVFDLCGTKIGIQICYDRKYPEGSRLLALKGAEILFMPICAATYGETKLRGNTWELPLQARAYENGVYVVAVNRCGLEEGRNHIGRSMIVATAAMCIT